jgi:hypothetical protein
MRTLNCGRRAERKAVNVNCSVKAKQGRSRRQRIVDLSTLGAWLRTSKPLDIGDLIDVCFALGGCKHDLRAEVMWTKPGRGGGMGIEFIGQSTSLDAPLCAAATAVGQAPYFEFADNYA